MKSVASDAATDLKAVWARQADTTVTVGLGSARAGLAIGKKAEGGDVYARDVSKTQVVTVGADLLTDLQKGATEYRRKDVFEFRPYNLTRLEVTRGSDVTTFERLKGKGKDGADVWQNVKAKKAVDGTKFESVLAKLSGLRAQSFADAKDEDRSRRARARAKATYDDGKKTETVRFGREGTAAYAGRADEPGASTLDTPEFEELIKSLDGVQVGAAGRVFDFGRSLFSLVLPAPRVRRTLPGHRQAPVCRLQTSGQRRRRPSRRSSRHRPSRRVMWGVVIQSLDRPGNVSLHAQSRSALCPGVEHEASDGGGRGGSARMGLHVRDHGPLDDGRWTLTARSGATWWSAAPAIQHPAIGRSWLTAVTAIADALWQHGVRRVEGRIIGDDDGFVDEPYGAGWAWDDLPFSYSAPIGALNYNENVRRATQAPPPSEAPQDTAVDNPTLAFTERSSVRHSSHAGSLSSAARRTSTSRRPDRSLPTRQSWPRTARRRSAILRFAC